MGERDEPWSHVLAIFSLSNGRPDRCTYSVGYGISGRPGAIGTGPVRRGALGKKQDKRSRAMGEQNSLVRESSSQ